MDNEQIYQYNTHGGIWRKVAPNLLIAMCAASPSFACEPETSKFNDYALYGEVLTIKYSNFQADTEMSAPIEVSHNKWLIALNNIQRKEMLHTSYAKSLKREGIKPSLDIEGEFFAEIAKLPFNDVLVQQDMADNSLDICTWYDKDVVLIINKDMDEVNSEDVMFSIYHGKKLLVCDEMPLSDLIPRFSSSMENIG